MRIFKVEESKKKYSTKKFTAIGDYHCCRRLYIHKYIHTNIPPPMPYLKSKVETRGSSATKWMGAMKGFTLWRLDNEPCYDLRIIMIISETLIVIKNHEWKVYFWKSTALLNGWYLLEDWTAWCWASSTSYRKEQGESWCKQGPHHYTLLFPRICKISSFSNFALKIWLFAALKISAGMRWNHLEIRQNNELKIFPRHLLIGCLQWMVELLVLLLQGL